MLRVYGPSKDGEYEKVSIFTDHTQVLDFLHDMANAIFHYVERCRQSGPEVNYDLYLREMRQLLRGTTQIADRIAARQSISAPGLDANLNDSVAVLHNFGPQPFCDPDARMIYNNPCAVATWAQSIMRRFHESGPRAF